jgi:hypothetical protein
MSKLWCVLVIVALTMVAGVATAERARSEERCRPGQDCTVIDYRVADSVLGEIVRPDGTIVPGTRRGGTERLFRPRAHFLPELMKSVEDI